MTRSQRSIVLTVLPVFMMMACMYLLPSKTLITQNPTDAARVTPTFHPSATATNIPVPSPTVSIPTFAFFRPVTRVDLDTSERVLDMLAESDNMLYLFTTKRVLQYEQGLWTDYLPQFNGTIVGMDADHHVWVVSDNRAQIAAWDGTAWANFDAQTGWALLPDNGIELRWGITTDALNQVWLATDQDVRMFDGTGWEVFSFDDLGMPPPNQEDGYSEISVVFLRESGLIWAINCNWIGPGPAGGGGTRWYDGNAWQGADSPVAEGCAAAIKEDSLGTIWLGLDTDLWQRDPASGSWERFPVPEPPQEGRFGFFSELELDGDGDPWLELVLCGGAACYTGNARYHFNGREWIQIGDIGIDNGSMYFDAVGQGWLVESNHIFQIIESKLEPISDELAILRVTTDPSGKLWILGNYRNQTILWMQAQDH